jgi:hypothetical protein
VTATSPTTPPDGDLLAQAIELTRPLLTDRSRTTTERIRVLWAAAKRSRDLGACDAMHAASRSGWRNFYSGNGMQTWEFEAGRARLIWR